MSIWKKEESPAPRPVSQPVVPPAATPMAASMPAAEPRKETSPVSSTSFRPEEIRNTTNATIGKGVRIVGQIFTKEDLNVDGDVEGSIESSDNKIIVGTNGRVQAGIKAREVVIFGSVQGNVEATDKVDIKKDAKLVGDIISARISIEDGALFKGSIDIRKPEIKAAGPAASGASAPTPPAPPPPPPAAAQPAAAPGGNSMAASGIRRP